MPEFRRPPAIMSQLDGEEPGGDEPLTKSESNLEEGLPRTVLQQPTFVFWRKTFPSTFSFGAKMSRAFACADQRLMASPLRQTSHSAMYRGFLPPFLFLWLLVQIFFHRPLVYVTPYILSRPYLLSKFHTWHGLKTFQSALFARCFVSLPCFARTHSVCSRALGKWQNASTNCI